MDNKFYSMSYEESMENYGTDKPDLRFGLKFVDLTDIFTESEFSVFKSVATDDINIIYLCWQHHSDYDSSWEKARKMRIWPVLKMAVRDMRPILKEKHKILSYFED